MTNLINILENEGLKIIEQKNNYIVQDEFSNQTIIEIYKSFVKIYDTVEDDIEILNINETKCIIYSLFSALEPKENR